MTQETAPHLPEVTGGVASTEQGQVILDGPDGVAVAMTPDAAEATARSLLEAVEQASGQSETEAHPS